MIYLDPELAQNLTSPEGLRAALSRAIHLELAVLPPYLYALYSLKPGTNQAIVDILTQIAREEMLHLVLGCNLLNAIGGQPRIGDPALIVRYPGHVAGGVNPGPCLSLEPFSLGLVERVFMPVEEPEDAGRYPSLASLSTIGSFYRTIYEGMCALGEPLFRNPQLSRQIEHPWIPGSRRVKDLPSAEEVIRSIVEQGEGTRSSPRGPDGQLAHYYRLVEIRQGRRFNPRASNKPGTPWDDPSWYTGDPIPFEGSGVYPAASNPHLGDVDPNSLAAHLGRAFSHCYTSLLNSLTELVNGGPQTLEDALGLMFSLKHHAKALFATPFPGGQKFGPTFEIESNRATRPA